MASDRLQKPVLVLNASYEPINVCAARRALVLVLKGVASAEEESHAGGSLRAQVGAAAARDPAAGVPPDSAPDTRALAQEHSDARPLHLPVLPSDDALGRVDAGPRDSAVARRRIGVGEPGGVLPSVQQPEGQPDAGRGGHEAGAPAASVQPAYQPAPDADAGQGRSAVAEVSVLLGAGTGNAARFEARGQPRCTGPGVGFINGRAVRLAL